MLEERTQRMNPLVKAFEELIPVMCAGAICNIIECGICFLMVIKEMWLKCLII